MKKILLVNYKQAFLERNEGLLNRAGFLILTATSAEEAFHLYREHSVDLIISLLDMPAMGGDALCSLIRQDADLKQVPYILVCYDTEAERQRASRCGANASLTRPVRPQALLDQVSKFLNISARRDYRAAFDATVHGTTESMPFSGMTRNISVSGLLCETSMLLNQDDLITDLLLTIKSHKIIAEGKVVWSETRPEGIASYGVQFTNLAPESREIVENFVAGSDETVTVPKNLKLVRPTRSPFTP